MLYIILVNVNDYIQEVDIWIAIVPFTKRYMAV